MGENSPLKSNVLRHLIIGRTFYDFEFFKILNYSKFAVECDGNTKISQSLTFLDYGWLFFQKNEFIKIATGGKIAAEYVSNDIISLKCFFSLNCEVFWRKIRKHLNLGK